MENLVRPPAAGGQIDEGNKIRQYWHVVLERRWLIVTTFAVVVILGAVYAFRATPIYEAAVQLRIDPERGGALALADVPQVSGRDQDYFQTELKGTTRRVALERLIDELDLATNPRYSDSADTVSAVLEDISVSPVRLTRLVSIKVRNPDPKLAARMANTLATINLELNQKAKMESSLEGFRLLREEQQTQEAELEAAIQELQDYRVKKGAVSLETDANFVTRGLIQAKEAYDTQRAAADVAEKRAVELRRWTDEGRSLVEFPDISQDEMVIRLKAVLAQNESKMAGLTNRYRRKHPQFLELADAIATDRENIRREAERVSSSIIQRAQFEKSRENAALDKLEAAQKEVEALNELKVKYDILTGKRDRADQVFQLILQKAKEYSISSKDVARNVSIFDRAEEPSLPVFPNRPLILAGCGASGLALGIALALLLNFFDDSVKSQEDVEHAMGVPFLGYIPSNAEGSLAERGLAAHLNPKGTHAEAFRTLRASIAIGRNSERIRRIAITSTIPSEGKSMIASNYAITIAQSGLRTLLVDADLRRPTIHKVFGTTSTLGLSAFLAGRVNSLQEVIHSTDVAGLDIVCCGSLPPNPSELLSSRRMLQFVEEASKSYDRVILDCPPISAVSDPLVTGALTDGIVYVTKFNKVRREHARRSISRIADAGLHIIGSVINDIDFEGRDSYYYSYYYYQNRYYSSHYSSRTPAPKHSSTHS